MGDSPAVVGTSGTTLPHLATLGGVGGLGRQYDPKVPLLPPTPLTLLQGVRTPGAPWLGTTGHRPLTGSAAPRPAWFLSTTAAAGRGGRCARSRRPAGAGAGGRGSWGACSPRGRLEARTCLQERSLDPHHTEPCREPEGEDPTPGPTVRGPPRAGGFTSPRFHLCTVGLSHGADLLVPS